LGDTAYKLVAPIPRLENGERINARAVMKAAVRNLDVVFKNSVLT